MSEMNGDHKVGIVVTLAFLALFLTIAVHAFNLADANSARDAEKVKAIAESCEGAENVPECVTLTLDAFDG